MKPERNPPGGGIFAALRSSDLEFDRQDGGGTLTIGLIEALQRYGHFDAYHFFVQDVRKALKHLPRLPAPEKTRILHVSQIPEQFAREDRYRVLFLPDMLTAGIIGLRDRYAKSPLPVCGVTYALSSIQVFTEALALQLHGCRSGDGLICLSKSAQAAVRQLLAPARAGLSPLLLTLARIPAGVHPEEFPEWDRADAKRSVGLRPGDLVIGYFGRLSDSSKADLAPLFRSFSVLLRSGATNHRLKLLIAGEDRSHPYARMLKELAEGLGCARHVRWTGAVRNEDRSRIYHAMDIFVLPADSFQESFGIVALEAMLCGCATVVSDWDGLKDLPDDAVIKIPTYLASPLPIGPEQVLNDTAFEFYSAQSCVVYPAALTGALRRLAGSEKLRRDLGRRAREAALRRYSWKAVVPRYESFITQLARQAARHPGPAGRPPDRTRAFDSFPTARLGASRLVRAARQRPTLLYRPQMAYLFETQGWEKILASARSWITLGELAHHLRAIGLSEMRACLALAYLVKHGLLELKPH